MKDQTKSKGESVVGPLRFSAWLAAVLILLLPLIAMQFTDSVNWSLMDFLFAAVLIVGVGISIELVMRKSRNITYQVAAGIALLAGLLLMWLSAGVGIIGADGDPANLMFLGVIAVGVAGALAARFSPGGMSRAMIAVAFSQILVTLIALIGQLGSPDSSPLQIVLLNGFFVAMYIASAWLFRRAGLSQESA